MDAALQAPRRTFQAQLSDQLGQPRTHWHLFDPDVVGWFARSATID
jgi:hypothetical protein